ncbi:hypothetical protein [Kineothrix sp. MB12-C1]|uniref:hypothetical protein n=1 Tax=Kineothrix sp. MB12-C1 TaxID=3070215 RepID=UPI0027D2C49F|nr:hypothetical protein [Kineothrix sp. MB12-C1]WMC91224.1 hypothetical protein RBB56_10040 [Kineothrix sp. MB12-C1]
MIICKRCKANCDNGEIIGGTCLDCREEEKQEQLRSDTVVKIMNSPSYQMELEVVK